jgi:hypothetical protein
MFRYRLLPTPAQEAVLRDHCAHARYIWNMAVEQHTHWRPGRKSAPGYLEQCRQLTQARAEYTWLATGSQMVQQQALRDFAHAKTAFLDPRNPARWPTWRKAGRDEGFRIGGKRRQQWDVRRLSRHVGEVRIPKAGWVRFGPERCSESRSEPGHPGFVLGAAGATPAGQGAGPSGEGQSRVYQPALLGVWACRSGEPQEPSPLRLRCLQFRLQR